MHKHKFVVVSTFSGGGNNGAGLRCECGATKVIGYGRYVEGCYNTQEKNVVRFIRNYLALKWRHIKWIHGMNR